MIAFKLNEIGVFDDDELCKRMRWEQTDGPLCSVRTSRSQV